MKLSKTISTTIIPKMNKNKFKEENNMKTYEVTYTETLVHTFYVEAKDEKEAEKVFYEGLMDDAFDLSDGDVTESGYTIAESDDVCNFHYKSSKEDM